MIVERSEKFAKETDDIGALVVHVATQVKAGKPVKELVSDSATLAKMIDALNGIDQIGKEFKADKAVFFRTIASRMAEAISIFISAPKAA